MSIRKEEIQALINRFEGFKKSHQGVEVWNGRDLLELFEYGSWQKFKNVIARAHASVTTNGGAPEDHFIHSDEMVETGSGAMRSRETIWMTRLGAYMVAMETDSKEYEAASFARAYFSSQTRQMELIQKQILEYEAETLDMERLDARQRYKEVERDFQDTLYQHKVDGPGIGSIRNEGDKVLFGGKTTEDMRWKLGIGGTRRPLADFLPATIVLAKALAASLTKNKVVDENLQGPINIGMVHIDHNKNVRNALTESGVYPENSEPQEDIKFVEKRIKTRKMIATRTQILPELSMSQKSMVERSKVDTEKKAAEPTHTSLFGDEG